MSHACPLAVLSAVVALSGCYHWTNPSSPVERNVAPTRGGTCRDASTQRRLSGLDDAYDATDTLQGNAPTNHLTLAFEVGSASSTKERSLTGTGSERQYGLRISPARLSGAVIEVEYALAGWIAPNGLVDLSAGYRVPTGTRAALSLRAGASTIIPPAFNGRRHWLGGINLGVGWLARIGPGTALRLDVTTRRYLVGGEPVPADLSSVTIGVVVGN